MTETAVQMEKFEGMKENVLPLREGRDARALAEESVEGETPTARRKRLDSQRKAFEDELSAVRSKSGDVLDVWKRYVKWAQQHFTTDARTELIPLLETCTRSLAGDTSIANDIRCLQLWIIYADLRGPSAAGDVFAHLRSREIGLGHALFYEALAAHYEQNARYQDATKAYQEGISKSAAPVDRLKRHFKQFLSRMAQRAKSGKLSQQAAPAHVNDENADAGRVALGILASGTTDPSRAPEKTATGTVRRAGLSLAAGTPLRKREATGQQVGIYCDEDGQPRGEDETPLPKRRAPEPAPVAQIRKENVMAPTQWTGARFPQKTKAVEAEKKEGVEIFVDQEFDREPRRNTLGEIMGYRKELLGFAEEEQQFEEARASVTKKLPEPAPVDAVAVQQNATLADELKPQEPAVPTAVVSEAPLPKADAPVAAVEALTVEMSSQSSQSSQSQSSQPSQAPAVPAEAKIEMKPAAVPTVVDEAEEEEVKENTPPTKFEVPEVKCPFMPLTGVPFAKLAGEDGCIPVNQSEPEKKADEQVPVPVLEPKVAPAPLPKVTSGELNPYDEEFRRAVAGGLDWEEYISKCVSERSPECPMKLTFAAAAAASPQPVTLQQTISMYTAKSRRMEENLAIYYAAEALACVEATHRRGIIHGAVSAGALVLRYGEPEEEWPEWESSETAAKSGSSWTGRGLALTMNPGCAVDVKALPGTAAKIVAPWTEGLRWAQEDSSRPWLWDVDAIGLCGVLHALAFDGTRLEWITDTDMTAANVTRQHRRLAQPLRKTWRAEKLWTEAFDALLNATPDAELVPTLSRLRQSFEAHLSSDARRAKSIKMLLIRQQIMQQEDSS